VKRHYACSRQSEVTKWVGVALAEGVECVERERIAGCICSWVPVV
jgi:hypothetical protein